MPLNSKSLWGFYAHKLIAKQTISQLPPQLKSFFQTNEERFQEAATNPDKRRFLVEGEKFHHYIDFEVWPDSLKTYWLKAPKQLDSVYSARHLYTHGDLPLHLMKLKRQLTNAFLRRDGVQIFKLAADAVHYLSDANVPLHTTRNYNGQLTGQKGIHAFWESQLPEAFISNALDSMPEGVYCDTFSVLLKQSLEIANSKVKTLLYQDRLLSRANGGSRPLAYQKRGKQLKTQVSHSFAASFYETQKVDMQFALRNSVFLSATFIYTCWVDAGLPELENLSKQILTTEEEDWEKEWKKRYYQYKAEDFCHRH